MIRTILFVIVGLFAFDGLCVVLLGIVVEKVQENQEVADVFR